MLFFVPIAYFLLAALGTALAKARRRAGRLARRTRRLLLGGACLGARRASSRSLAALALADAPRALAVGVAQIGPVFFAWALAQCYAEAFGFRRAWAVFAVIGGIVLVILLAIRLASL